MQLHCSSLLSPLAFLGLLRSLQGWIFVPQKFTPWSLSCASLSPLCNFPLHSPYPSSPLFVSLLFPHFSLYPETYIMFSGDELIHKCPRSFIHKPLREKSRYKCRIFHRIRRNTTDPHFLTYTNMRHQKMAPSLTLARLSRMVSTVTPVPPLASLHALTKLWSSP